ncbi:MAG: hypothetical protein ACKE5M_00535 [Methylophilaceae bacterium]
MLANVLETARKTIKHGVFTQDIEWLDTLSGMTELESLITIKDELSKIDFLDLKRLESKVDFVLEVDKSTYKKVKHITHNYLIELKNNKELKKDIQVVAYEYHRQLYAAYSQILDAYQAQEKVKLSAKKTNLLLARYLNATFMMSKWRYFDDQSAPIGVWENVHKVIKLAEELAMINQHIFLYDFQIKETSIATILKRGFMVDTLHKGNYSQLEIELTDRILKIWASNPLIVNTYKADRYHFFIQLEGDKGPDRMRMKEKFSNCRYWKTTRLIDLMEAYLCAVDMQKPLREFGLEKIAPSSVVLKLFKKLRVDWCVEGYSRQRRVEERNQKNSLLNVSHGLDSIHQRLMRIQVQQQKEAAKDAGFTFELNATQQNNDAPPAQPARVLGSENWWMVDESKSGFAVDFGKEPADWVETGGLIGYSEMGYQKTFNIAEIRSVRKLPNGAYRAGFKKISHNVIAVKVSRVEKTSIAQPVSGFYVDEGEESINYSDEFTGLLVDDDGNNFSKLLMPRKRFKRGGTFNVNIDGENQFITAGKVITKHNDWILFDTLI